MADFLEERISDLIRYGSSYYDEYSVNIVRTAGGQEHRSLIHSFPVRTFDISYMLDSAITYQELQAIYHRAHGRYAGFRARCFDEWSSNGRNGVPTAFDQPLSNISNLSYQLRKYYGKEKSAGASGYPFRNIKKPVAGSVLVGIGSTAIRSVDWSVDNTTGIVTFGADWTASITGISKATQAVISFSSNVLAIGQSVRISGVSGMTQINGMRALVVAITATSATVAINSTSFSTYTSGGVVHTNPQAGETVSAGFEFDFPVRFDSTLPIGQDYPGYRSVDGVRLIEIINP